MTAGVTGRERALSEVGFRPTPPADSAVRNRVAAVGTRVLAVASSGPRSEDRERGIRLFSPQEETCLGIIAVTLMILFPVGVALSAMYWRNTHPKYQ